MSAENKQWIVSPRTKRKYAICQKTSANNEVYFAIECKAYNATISKMEFKTYTEAFIFLQKNFKTFL